MGDPQAEGLGVRSALWPRDFPVLSHSLLASCRLSRWDLCWGRRLWVQAVTGQVRMDSSLGGGGARLQHGRSLGLQAVGMHSRGKEGV